jgi:hypothetical protein
MHRAAALVLVLSLAGCGRAEREPAAPAPVDPAIADALADPIMTDLELAVQNEAHAAIGVSGPVNAALPPIDRSDEAISAAKAAAGTIRGAPPAEPGDTKALREAVTAGQMASAARIATPACIGEIRYTARWAAQLPAGFDLYPRGAVEEAAGVARPGCAFRVVHYATPVPVEDVIAFHHAGLRAAGYPAQRLADGADQVLRGRKGATAYVVYVRRDERGLIVVDVILGGA